MEPRVALLSFSNFGSTRHPLRGEGAPGGRVGAERCPDLPVDGEMQADTAVVPEIVDSASRSAG
jgi:malate dehydrogenase (oxaloacetate-decarboxylating)(NADP+)